MQCSTWKSRFVPLKCVPAARNLRTSSSFIYRTSENCRHHENFPLSYGDRGQCHIDPSLGSTEVQKDSTYITWSSSVRKICLSYLIYFSVTYISVYISLILWVTIQYYIIYFIVGTIMALAIGSFQVGSCVPLTYFLLVFEHLLTLKNLPEMQEIWIWSLGQEDPLEKEMATLSSILAWEIPWTEEPGGLHFMGPQRVRHDWSD